MNLRNIAKGVTGVITPDVNSTWRKSNGYDTAGTGKRTPKFTDVANTKVRLQALSGKDLKQMEGLNIQGVMRALYVNGDVQGVSRTRGTGGDEFVINGESWLTVQILESWPGWSKVAICLQLP